ncbi:MAG: hypothetical protein R2798_05515 [Chitinophagales bacterium]
MDLLYNDFEIVSSPNQIDCYEITYYPIKKKLQWSIFMNEKIRIKTGKKEIFFDPNDITEFWFEIEQHRRSRMGVGYIILKQDKDPKEFFYMAMFTEILYKPIAEIEVYQYSEQVMQYLSEKYQIPYFYKKFVTNEAKIKRNFEGLTAIIILWVIMYSYFILSLDKCNV